MHCENDMFTELIFSPNICTANVLHCTEYFKFLLRVEE